MWSFDLHSRMPGAPYSARTAPRVSQPSLPGLTAGDDDPNFIPPVPTLRVRALCSQADVYGRVQAGWVLSQIDLAGTWEAERLTNGPVATASINAFQFVAPILHGDLVNFYVESLRKGQRSLTLKITVTAERTDGSHTHITEVTINFVAIDEHGKARLLKETLL